MARVDNEDTQYLYLYIYRHPKTSFNKLLILFGVNFEIFTLQCNLLDRY